MTKASKGTCKILISILIIGISMLLMRKEVHANNEISLDQGKCVSSVATNVNYNVSGTEKSVVFIANNMQEAQEYIKNIKVSGQKNSITIKCYSKEVEQYLLETINQISVKGTNITINVVLETKQTQKEVQSSSSQETVQTQKEVQSSSSQETVQTQKEVQSSSSQETVKTQNEVKTDELSGVESTKAPIEDISIVTEKREVQLSQSKKPSGAIDSVPETSDESYVKQVMALLVVSLAVMIMVVIIKRGKDA